MHCFIFHYIVFAIPPVADLGFPRRGSAKLKVEGGGVPTYYYDRFIMKTA